MTSVRDQIRAMLDRSVVHEPALDALTVMPSTDVSPALVRLLCEIGAARWQGGWQPEELHRLIVRRGGRNHGDLVRDAVALRLRELDRSRVDPRWLAQADALLAMVWWSADRTYLDELGALWRLDRSAVLNEFIILLATLNDLPSLPVLIPPPGTIVHSGQHGIDSGLVHRVRALLAKAESTTHPAEAEAYTAKAQVLVARHSLDAALLSARSDDPTLVPLARRIGVAPPYESEQVALLHAVADANRCHAVWSPDFGFVTVFGFEADIDAVELLYASVLVQGSRAMARTEPPGGKAGRVRLRSYRTSFLVAYAVRIGERLGEATHAAQAATPEPGVELVLASRDEQVRESLRQTFPHTVRGRGTRVDSAEGWHSGRSAADTATLHR